MKIKKQGFWNHLKITYLVMYPSIMAIFFIVLIQEEFFGLAGIAGAIMMVSWFVIAEKLLKLKVIQESTNATPGGPQR